MYTVFLNDQPYGAFQSFSREEIKALLLSGTQDNHVQVYSCGYLIIDRYTADLRNLPNYY